MDRAGKTGVSSKRGRCQVSFVYQGDRYRIVLPGLLWSRKSDRREAQRILATVHREITVGTFYFPKHFPNHPDAKRFLKGHQISIKEALEEWLRESRVRIEPTTYKGYDKVIRYHLIPAFGTTRLAELRQSDVEDWLGELDITGKSKNNILIPLRAVFRKALRTDVIERDPLSRIEHLSHRAKAPDPLSRAEIEAVLGATEGQVQNIIEFAIWTGLRTSELIAVRWEDVDFANKRIHIRMTRTSEGEKAYGKTETSVRTVDMHPQAQAALRRQLVFTEGKAFVFENPRTGQPWKHDGPYRKTAWTPALKRAQVRHRPAYQTRHTFASMLLSAGVEPMYVAAQMGHRDWGMIRKVYGRWLPEFSKDQQAKIARLWAPDRHRRNANS